MTKTTAVAIPVPQRRFLYKNYKDEHMTLPSMALGSNRLDLVDDLVSKYLASGPATGLSRRSVQLLLPLVHDAIHVDNSAFIAKLMQRGFEVKHFFREAVEKHALRCLTLFLETGYDINQPECDMKPPVWTRTTVDSPITFWLIARGANLNAHAPYHIFTPMSFAAQYAQAGLVHAYLTDPRGLVDIGTGDLLQYALDRKADVLPVLSMLLDHGAPINEGLFARHLASQNMFFFMPRGPPLHKAAEKGQLDAVRLLLDRHADVTIRDTKGKTALFYAEKEGHREVAEVLRQAMEAAKVQHL
ncbi:hypothetical protein SPBR_08614 [Sporothrix brasiliensis 5110]|uniref:Uncharacterized protein n=1 Tax=Sporothrix brasiliensis 5110 TaxID=1398154 RepID=A0A0C2IHQ6_9PEZI|nr:uncharacterized protein SPBR_08614 [Sporothrix brasiliensis 5110]KIH86535.1 hypothetical protein SPBR_08614 [Sporothrix brasiliensis 5110]